MDLFEHLHTEFVLIGGVAVSAMGRGRFTHDVDATAVIDSDDVVQFLRVAAEFGFRPRIENVEEFARRARLILLHHVPSQVDIDISIAGLPFEFEAIQRAWMIPYRELLLPVASPEDLLIMKAVAHRPSDLADIEELLLSHPDVDLARIRGYLPQFAEILDDPAVVSEFERLVAAWRATEESDKSSDLTQRG